MPRDREQTAVPLQLPHYKRLLASIAWRHSAIDAGGFSALEFFVLRAMAGLAFRLLTPPQVAPAPTRTGSAIARLRPRAGNSSSVGRSCDRARPAARPKASNLQSASRPGFSGVPRA